MKKQKARGQVRRFLRRSIACLLAIVGMGMAAVTAGLPQPLGWLGDWEESRPPWRPRPRRGRACALLAAAAAGGLRPAGPVGRGIGGPGPGEKPEETAPEEAEEEQNLQAVTPDKIQEKTISGSGSGYVNAQGISLFNRTEKTVDLEAVAKGGSSLSFQKAEAGPKS